MFGLFNRGELDPVTEHELEHTNARLQKLWLTEHNEDGTHVDLVAKTNVENEFTANQKVSKVRPEFQIEYYEGGPIGRVVQPVTDQTQYTHNARYDGVNWYLDDITQEGCIYVQTIGFHLFYKLLSGSNPATPVLQFAIPSTGAITSNHTIALAGGQLHFPAVQIPSADPNTLDDYEEGLWTPTLISTGGGTPVYASTHGNYVKIGQQVVASWNIQLTGVGTLAAGFIRLSSLPFTVNSPSAAYAPIDTVFFTGMNTNFSNIVTVTRPSVTYAELYGIGAAGPSMIPLIDTNLTAGTNLVGTLVYRASA